MSGIGQGVLTKCKITFSSYSLDQAFIVSTLNITENLLLFFQGEKIGFLQGDCQLKLPAAVLVCSHPNDL